MALTVDNLCIELVSRLTYYFFGQCNKFYGFKDKPYRVMVNDIFLW